MKYQTGWKINMLENNKQALEKEIEELKARLNEYEKIKRKHEHRLFCKSSEYVCDNKFKSCSYDGVIDYIIDDVVKFKEHNDIWEKEYNKLKEIISKIDKRVPIEKVLDLLDAYEKQNDELMKDNSILIKDNTKLMEKVKPNIRCMLKELNDSRNYNDIHIEDIEDAICFLGRNNKYGEVYVSDSVKIIRSVYEEIQFKILFDKKDIIETCELDEMLYFLMNNKKFQIEMDDFDFSEVMGFIKTIYDCSLDDRIKVTFESDMSDIKDNIIYYNKG